MSDGDQFYGGEGEMPLHYKGAIAFLIVMFMLLIWRFVFNSDEDVGLPASEIPAVEKIQYGPYGVPIGIDTATGFRKGGSQAIGNTVKDAEECRQMVLNSNGKYAAWVYRTPQHNQPEWRNTCFAYPTYCRSE